MTLIIGFGNKARQGKDTAANAIVEHYDHWVSYKTMHPGVVEQEQRVKAVRIGFADALYEVARQEYGMTTKDAPLLQKIGAERRDMCGVNYWVDRVAMKIKPKHDIVVIPDVRYKNEAVWVKDIGGYLVNITRMNGDGTRFVDPSRPADHPSEIDLDGWNWDFKWLITEGHAALTGELAVTLAEYLRGLHRK